DVQHYDLAAEVAEVDLTAGGVAALDLRGGAADREVAGREQGGLGVAQPALGEAGDALGPADRVGQQPLRLGELLRRRTGVRPGQHRREADRRQRLDRRAAVL